MKGKIDICIKNDYAVMSTKNYGFYYGYEFDSKEDEDGDQIDIFGFETCEEDNQFRISYDEMSKHSGCPSKWECDKCLLFGIGLWLEDKKGNK